MSGEPGVIAGYFSTAAQSENTIEQKTSEISASLQYNTKEETLTFNNYKGQIILFLCAQPSI